MGDFSPKKRRDPYAQGEVSERGQPEGSLQYAAICPVVVDGLVFTTSSPVN